MEKENQEKRCLEWIEKPEKMVCDGRKSKELSILRLESDEVFVPFYDYRNNEIDKRFCVSNYGKVVSFANHNNSYNPTLLKHINKNKSAYTYVTVNGDRLRLHRVIWFAFMADYLKNDNEYEDLDFLGLNIWSFEDLKKVDSSCIEVHHKKEPPIDNYVKDNALYNLQGLPDEFHEIFSAGLRIKDLDKRKKYFLEQEERIQEYALCNEMLHFVVNDEYVYVSSAVKFSNVDRIFWNVPFTTMDRDSKIIARNTYLKINEEKEGDYLDIARRILISNSIEHIVDKDKCRQWDMLRVKHGIKVTQLSEDIPVSRKADIFYNTTTNSAQFIYKVST